MAWPGISCAAVRALTRTPAFAALRLRYTPDNFSESAIFPKTFGYHSRRFCAMAAIDRLAVRLGLTVLAGLIGLFFVRLYRVRSYVRSLQKQGLVSEAL